MTPRTDSPIKLWDGSFLVFFRADSLLRPTKVDKPDKVSSIPLKLWQQAEATCEFFVRNFDLNDESDRDQYQLIQELVAMGVCRVDERRRSFDKNQKYPIVYMEWIIMYTQYPARLADA